MKHFSLRKFFILKAELWEVAKGEEMENAPAIKANEANLEELNKRIVEIKRKIVLKGERVH